MPETTQERVARTLRYMEHLRMEAMEAEPKEAKRMMQEYNILWESIKDDV